MATISPTKKQNTLIEAALSGKYTFILFGGAVGGAKTLGLFLLFLLAHRIFPGIQVIFVRKDMATIERNSYATWNEFTSKFGIPETLKKDARFDNTNPRLEMTNGSNLIFFGENFDKDKNLTRWSGLIPNWFFADEINELQYNSYTKMYERAGRYQLKTKQPHPLIIGTCNPSHGWVKEQIYDKWKKDELPGHILYIPSKITDNPHLPKEYINNLKNLPRYEYEVYVEGNWDIQLKTGGEFWKDFELDKHVKPISFNSELPIHVSIDNNVYPYISISAWQIDDKRDNNGLCDIMQIQEIPAKDPENTATKAARLLVKWLHSIAYDDVIFLYGDKTTKNRNTIDDEKKSFLDKFVDEVKKEYAVRVKMPNSNPSPSKAGEFINAIYSDNFDNLNIIISESCKESINDYVMTKQDVNGNMLKKRTTDKKTGVSYEEHAHISDTKKDFICEAFKSSFRKHGKRFEREKTGYVGNQFTDRRF